VNERKGKIRFLPKTHINSYQHLCRITELLHPSRVMSKLESKLREVKNKRARREFLEAADSKLSEVLSRVEFSHDVQCLKYAAFSTWDMEADIQTTTRGNVEGWELTYFDSMGEMVSFVKSTVELAIIPGWFFIDADGPYYSLTLSEFILNLNLLRVT